MEVYPTVILTEDTLRYARSSLWQKKTKPLGQPPPSPTIPSHIPEDQKQLWGDSGSRHLHNLPYPPPPQSPLPLGLFSPRSFLFSLSLFPFPLCYRGTNRLFCQIAKNFKVCLTCTLGRPALGASVSHAETWGRVLKAPCVSTLLTFKAEHSLLTLTWLLWIKYVSSLSQQLH